MSAPSSEIVDSGNLLLLLQQTRSLLTCHKTLGLTMYPASAGLRQMAAKRTGVQPVARPTGDASLPPAPLESRLPATSATPSFIAQQTAECKNCPWAAANPIPEPDLRLTVVCDCLDTEASSSLIWSHLEDQLFWKMLAAIELAPSAVHVVRLVKCVRTGGSGPCLAKLDEELRIVAPLLVCVMGAAAARILTGLNIPLARLRKRLHRCCRPSALQSMVLPTYHPGFLLEHPDMKPAAWEDLLLLKREIATGAARKQAVL